MCLEKKIQTSQYSQNKMSANEQNYKCCNVVALVTNRMPNFDIFNKQFHSHMHMFKMCVYCKPMVQSVHYLGKWLHLSVKMGLVNLMLTNRQFRNTLRAQTP